MKKIIFAGMFFLATLCAYSTTNVAIERRYGSWIISLEPGISTQAIQFYSGSGLAKQPFTESSLNSQASTYQQLVDKLEEKATWKPTQDPLVTTMNMIVPIPVGGSTQFTGDTKKKITISWNDFSRESLYFFFFENSAWKAYKISTGFFPEEKIMINHPTKWGTHSGLTYEQKQLVFLNKVLDGKLKTQIDEAKSGAGNTDFFASSINIIPGGVPVTSAWTVFDDWDVTNEIQSFKSEFLRHFPQETTTMWNPSTAASAPDSKINLIFLNSVEKDFEGLYGGKRNPYVFSYLWFIYQKNKPILSQVIADYQPTNSIYNYNFEDYSPVTTTEGEKLAEAALRFLTWAPEYTKAPGGDQTNNQVNDVTPKFSTEINDWIGSSNMGNRNVVNNYLPGGLTVSLDSLESTGLAVNATTPFTKFAVTGLTSVKGNPLPYLRYGFDLPRTFAWKLNEQRETRIFLTKKTFGNYYSGSSFKAYDDQGKNENYFKFYVNEFSIYEFLNKSNPATPWSLKNIRDNRTYAGRYPSNSDIPQYGVTRISLEEQTWVLKPFLPGAFGPQKQMNEPWGPMGTSKGAGVDSVGILLGAAAMADIPVHNFRNDNNAENLNTYSRMTTTANVKYAGLDVTGKPSYWTTGAEDWIHFKWTKTDMERNTILVPDIRLIQAGDLLVSYNAPISERATKDFTYNANNIPDMHVGIIVGIPSFKGSFGQDLIGSVNASTFWSTVKVVSIRPGLRNVTLGTWGNAENSLGGFTLNPKQYQIRRLLKWKEKVTQPNGTIIDRVAQANGVPRTYELIDARPQSLEVSITFNESFDRFIPNTGEPLALTNAVKIKAKNKGQVEVRLSGNNRIVFPSIPQDAYFDLTKNPNTYGNIHNNTGGGLEYIVEDTDDKWKVVAQFTANDFNADSSTKDNRYTRNFTLNNSVGGNFVIDDSGTVSYSKNGEPLSWGIRPQTPSGTVKIRPGDDFFIGFELKNQSDVQGWNVTQRLAIYDKKMLWRANLYLDEDHRSALNNGVTNDWNDRFPWNAPPNETGFQALTQEEKNKISWGIDPVTKTWNTAWGFNEWNWQFDPHSDYNKFTRTEGTANNRFTETFTGLTMGNGGQIVVIPSSTWGGDHETPFVNHENTNYSIDNSVIYAFGNTTSPFQFGKDMELLRQEIFNYWNGLKLGYEAQKVNNPAVQIPQAVTSMVNEWLLANIVRGPTHKKEETINGVKTYPSLNNQPVWDYYEQWSRVPGAILHPGVHPGYNDVDNDLFPFQDPAIDDVGRLNGKRVTGLDCGGLVYMSCAYAGSPYTINGLADGHRPAYLDLESRKKESEQIINGVTVNYDNDNLRELVYHGNGLQADDPIPTGKYFVPGDIYYYMEYHIGIVSSIDNSNPTPGQVHVIEEVYRTIPNSIPQGRVMKEYSLQGITTINKPWNVGRIIIQ